ncbi:DUF4351 domain-containing protein [Nevskia soli]|jgi:predicted transposase YdaD|uniref:DUF4351 domain-containing protein n=1 Tax=Nevskia soli TaxID=418856 RepID=UPI0015D72650|nr:DUF4351 domain-containing protein [Nevskia soli]
MAQQYDVTLKMLLQDSDGQAVHLATGLSVAAWLNIELPKIANPRVDLLGQTDDGSLLHLELQVGNDAEMPMRMAEYALAIYRSLGKFARQIVLYAGEPELRMETTLQGPGFSFRYEVIDLRDVDGDTLLASDNLGDNVLAIVTRLRDQQTAIEEILRKISTRDETRREQAIEQLLILAGLRGLEEAVEEAILKMATINDIILSNKVLGREYKRGREEGELEGELKGELKLFRRLIEKRFGAIPEWADERLNHRSTEDLEALSVRLLDGATLEELLQ